MFPLRSAKPVFREDYPSSLRRYFEDVEVICERDSGSRDPTSEEMIKRALYYTPDPFTEDLWKSYNTPGILWPEFKEKILDLYPGSDARLWRSDLEEFIAKSAKGQFKTVEDVGRYHREFAKIANRLAPELISLDIEFKYCLGIPPAFYKQIDERLVMMPAMRDRPRGEYTRDEVYAAALRIINDEKGYI
ncbi:hypothetical protein K438DRAFT_12844 [Mycena galopus ATCC 62051]|nr:hypothetical protein K438DRAFT_12844 [Mycena galopus ATCC 62051]